jgi:Domain of unknown function DUF488
MVGTLYTIGYVRANALRTISRGIASRAKLFDIRYAPRSRRPEWSRKRLSERFGSRYRHLPKLGNANYHSATLPVQLVAPERGISMVCDELANGSDVCLLCACGEVTACHRLIVAQLVQAACSCKVVHL